MSDFHLLLPRLIDQLESEAAGFEAGRLKHFECAWKQYTSDPHIISLIKGAKIEFDCPLAELSVLSRSQPSLSAQECEIINREIEKLIAKKVISTCEHVHDEVLSSVFTRQKKDGSHRMILNLKGLNEQVSYHHFKMDTLKTALKLITKNCYMASIDLKDAYYSVPVHEHYKKFLRFQWGGQLYEYNALPNGLALAPRQFTKLLKPVFSFLRQKGLVSTSFLDDSLLAGDSKWECVDNLRNTILVFQELGFVIHPTKSVFEPTRRIQYLGVVIDSESMTVTLTKERAESIQDSCRKLKHQKQPSIRLVAQVIGKIVASFPAVKFGQLHYRDLENDKKAALQKSKGDFDQPMSLSPGSKSELDWWLQNVCDAYNDICPSAHDVTLMTDASLTGWGCDCEGEQAGGQWLPTEKEFHINYLEIHAAFLALKCFANRLENKHVRLMIDNTTAVACINNMGTSHSIACNSITQAVWNWCISHKIWISAAHIPGRENTVADGESRKINLDAEWKLDSTLLQASLSELEFTPCIDLFASRLNSQFPRYVAYRPDPQATAIDAFSFSWKDMNFYAFPPFSVIPRVLQKVQLEQSTGVLVVPDWPTQTWFPVVQRMLMVPPIQLSCRKNLLQLPSQPQAVHPLIDKKRLRLLVCKISGANSRPKV